MREIQRRGPSRNGFVLLAILFAFSYGLAENGNRKGSDGSAYGTITGNKDANGDIAKALDDKNAAGDPDLRPGMLLDICVMASGTKEIEEKNKRIGQDGTILLPLIGTVRATGISVPDLASRLTQAYRKYYKAPQVEVEFVMGPGSVSPWGYVTVLGRVSKPGRVNVPSQGDLSVSVAIQEAGGLAKSADETSIIVVRKNKAGDAIDRFEVDLHSAARKGEAADMKLSAGDVVYVPVRIF